MASYLDLTLAAQSQDRRGTDNNPNGAYGNYGAIEHTTNAQALPSLEVVQENQADPFLRYRRHLTLEELMFAWNAVIIYLLTMFSIMTFTVIMLLCLYGDKLFATY